MVKLFTIWFIATCIGSISVFYWARIELAPEPPLVAAIWATEALHGLPKGIAVPTPPPQAMQYRAQGPVFVTAWWQGQERAHFFADSFVEAVEGAARRFSQDRALTALPGWSGDMSNPVLFTLSVTRGSGPLVQHIPFVSSLALVPMLEGVAAEFNGRRVYLPPERLWAGRVYQGAVVTPIPDLTFGVDLAAIGWRLASELGVSRDQLLSKGKLWRFRTTAISAHRYPAQTAGVNVKTLRNAAFEGARFLLRHQEPNGRFSYVYDAVKGQSLESDRYSLPRHAGTAYFLAQVDRFLGMPEARSGALRALSWVRKYALQSCGATDRPCVGTNQRPDVGSSALTVLAASELLQKRDEPWVRELMAGLAGFLRSMQRPDGELMHVYDLATQRPIDVQRMYYSGEAAFALLRAYQVLKDNADLAAAKRVMKHLTGAGWSFFGSRYYYGEEHWTCQAVAEASRYMNVSDALDFCLRWAAFGRKAQHRDTGPWSIRGAYVVGPLLLPRFTPVASRTEAAIATYQMARAYGRNTDDIRGQIEAGLELLLRYQWTPGPVYLFYDPSAARGGVPGSPVDLTVRNDFVQHAGSAMLLWAEQKQKER